MTADGASKIIALRTTSLKLSLLKQYGADCCSNPGMYLEMPEAGKINFMGAVTDIIPLDESLEKALTVRGR